MQKGVVHRADYGTAKCSLQLRTVYQIQISLQREKMEPKVIWIKIDPSLLIEGFDYQGFFGDDSFLKFNITPDETDIDPGTTNVNSTNHPNVKGDGLEITSSEKKSEQKFDQETATLLRSKTNNRQGIPSSCSECGLTTSSVASLKEHVKGIDIFSLKI